MKSKLKYIGIGAFVGIVLVLGVAATATDFRMGRTMEILVNMVREISDSYVDVTDADKLLRDAADGMTSGLDAYTYFLDEKDLEGFEVLTTGRYAGIGSGIRQRGDTTIFAEPYKGFPADRAGIRIGDAIVEIDGKSAIGIGTDKVSEMLRGDVGSVANITFKCLADGTIRKVDIRREMIVRSGVVYSAMLNDTTGYINHADFTDNVSADFRAALEAIIASGATRVIIDERSNGGGILQEAVKILSLFLPVGTEVVEMRGRIESESRTFYTELEPIGEHLDLVVLINEGTASSSEIVAGALQDLGKATLVGRHSFGKGVVQSTRGVGYNTYLKLTTARYYLPSGRTLERETGLTPDIETIADPMSRLAYELYGRGYLDDFADVYWREHQSLTISDPTDFVITDSDWENFKTFVTSRIGDTEIDLDSSRDELSTMLAMEIILRYNYVEGVYRYSVGQDKEIEVAIAI